MTEEQRKTESGLSRERHSIRVLIREEDMETVKGQGYRINGLLPEGTEVVEGQVYVLRVPRPGEQVEDTEGQGGRYSGVGQIEEDVEGQGGRAYLRPEGDDTEGQGYRYNLDPVAEDVDGQGGCFGRLIPDDTDPGGGTWRLEIDDVEGQGARFGG